jgi:hypothetical protein
MSQYLLVMPLFSSSTTQLLRQLVIKANVSAIAVCVRAMSPNKTARGITIHAFAYHFSQASLLLQSPLS